MDSDFCRDLGRPHRWSLRSRRFDQIIGNGFGFWLIETGSRLLIIPLGIFLTYLDELHDIPQPDFSFNDTIWCWIEKRS